MMLKKLKESTHKLLTRLTGREETPEELRVGFEEIEVADGDVEAPPEELQEGTNEAEAAWERMTMGPWMGKEGTWVKCTPEQRIICNEPA